MAKAAVAIGLAAVSAGGGGTFRGTEITDQRRADGSIVLRSARGLGPVPRSIGVLLERWAVAEPARIFLAERAGIGCVAASSPTRRRRRRRNAIGQALLDRGLGADRPVALLSDNGVDHGR